MDNFFETDTKNRQILQLIATSRASVKEISEKLFMSQATVRRHLTELEKQKLIIRTHGGAVINSSADLHGNAPLYLRTSQFDEEKRHIASKAVKLVSDGNVLFIDSSSTALCLLSHLCTFRDLTVCTNSLRAAVILSELSLHCILLGGDVLPGEQACNSPETFDMIEQINADLFFFSCDALSEDGVITDNSRHSCLLRSHYLKNAKKSVLLIDSTKLGKRCCYKMCTLNDIDYCVSNAAFPLQIINSSNSTIFM